MSFVVKATPIHADWCALPEDLRREGNSYHYIV
jgi:hypothetical protein